MYERGEPGKDGQVDWNQESALVYRRSWMNKVSKTRRSQKQRETVLLNVVGRLAEHDLERVEHNGRGSTGNSGR